MRTVSIIIPIYNKETYLEECLKSILQQSYEDIEVICINDCSQDRSYEILQKFAKQDKRVKIVNNAKNLGAAYARNLGLTMAEGEYVLFLDADDIFAFDLVERAYERCKRDELDIVLYDYEQYNNVTGKTQSYAIPLPMIKRLPGEVFSAKDIEGFSFQLCIAAPWIKMYRRKFLVEKKMRFQDLSSSNDALFGKMTLLLAERIGYLDRSLVKYRSNAKEQISNNRVDGVLNFAKASLQIKEEMQKYNVYDKNAKSFHTYALKTMLMHLYRTRSEYMEASYEQITEGLQSLFSESDMESLFINGYEAMWLKEFYATPIQCHEQRAINNEYYYIFKYQMKKVNELWQLISGKKLETVLWGYGKKGKLLTEQWEKMGLPIHYIVDGKPMDERDRAICLPKQLPVGKYAILVPSAVFIKGILKTIQTLKGEFMVIDVQSYLENGFALEECLF